MRSCVLALFTLCACGGAQSTATNGEPEATSAPSEVTPAESTSLATATAAPTLAASSGPAPSASASALPPKKGEEWTVAKGTANGVSLTNELGQPVQIGTMSWTAFRRQTEPMQSLEIMEPNVSFGSVTADGAVAKDAICRLQPWESPPTDPLLAGAVIVPLVAHDTVPIASLLKSKAALSACAPKTPLRVRWSFTGSKVEMAHAIDEDGTRTEDKKVNACIEKVAMRSVGIGTGMCVVTLDP